MPEYTVNITSPEGASHDEDALERFQDALTNDGRPLGPSCSFNVRTGQLSTTFQVVAENRDEAAFSACLAYWDAIAAAGASLNGDSTVTLVELDDEQSTTFSAAIAIAETVA